MSDWIEETVKDYCLMIGLSVDRMPVAIHFERRGMLSLEQHNNQLLIILSRSLLPVTKEATIKKPYSFAISRGCRDSTCSLHCLAKIHWRLLRG